LLAGPWSPAAAEPEGQRLHIAGLDVVAWLPAANTPGPWPVVIFSHGFHGCATQSEFLTAGLAEAGYAVFAPEHRDAACGHLLAWLQPPEAAFGKPASWTADDYRDRAQDIEALIDALARDPRFSGPRFDYRHIGLVGHSLGGYTVLGLAGAWPQWKDKRVKAVLALSPYAAPYVALGTLRGLALPVMYQGGTLDFGITPTVSREGGAYAQTPAPKYFVDFDRAGHLAWTDLNPFRHGSILAYGRAFLDRYLKGVPFPPALAVPQDGVAALWIDK
jgi:predicted dienelactone hydrolase